MKYISFAWEFFFIGDKFLTDVPLTVNGHLKDNNCPKI
jgi:hypothetical protein